MRCHFERKSKKKELPISRDGRVHGGELFPLKKKTTRMRNLLFEENERIDQEEDVWKEILETPDDLTGTVSKRKRELNQSSGQNGRGSRNISRRGKKCDPKTNSQQPKKPRKEKTRCAEEG